MVTLYITEVILSYFLWAYIHESAHLIAYDFLVGIKSYTMKIYPHKTKYGWRWASVTKELKHEIGPKSQALASIAPRIPNFIAAIAFPFSHMFDNWVWAILFGAGLIDLFVGSIGYNKYSDLCRSADGFNISPWILRIIGFSLIIVSTGIFIALF